MKKKIIISITAVVMALSMLFVLTACERTEVPTKGIREGMTAGEIVEYLLKTDIKSFTYTMEQIGDGKYVTRFTENGNSNSVITDEGEEVLMGVEFYEDGRVYRIEFNGTDYDMEITEIGELSNYKNSPVENNSQDAMTGLIAMIFTSAYIDKNNYPTTTDEYCKVTAETGKIKMESEKNGTVELYDINSTTLPIPESCKDYKTRPATATNLNYEEKEDGTLKLTGVKNSVKELIVPSSYNGKTVTEIYFDGYRECDKIVIPTSVTTISSGLDYLATNVNNVYYVGTVQEWKDNVTAYATNNDVIIHCSDGDVNVTKG